MNEQYLKKPESYLRKILNVYSTGNLEALAAETEKLELEFAERVEGRTRSIDSTEALRLRVHDPLWMLARQWQMGEFRGNNTGTAMSVSCTLKYDKCSEHPIEPVTEQINPCQDFLTKIESAIYYLDLVRVVGKKSAAELKKLRVKLIKSYPIKWEDVDNALVLPNAVTANEEKMLNSHLLNYAKTYRGKIFDGTKLYRYLIGRTLTDKTVDEKFVNWFKEKYEPTLPTNDHWQDEDLCYEVETKVAGNTFKGDRYQGGRLSWYTFDFESSRPQVEKSSELAMILIKNVSDQAMVKSSLKLLVQTISKAYPLADVDKLPETDEALQYFKENFKCNPFDSYAFCKDLKRLQKRDVNTFRAKFEPTDLPRLLVQYANELDKYADRNVFTSLVAESVAETVIENAKKASSKKYGGDQVRVPIPGEKENPFELIETFEDIETFESEPSKLTHMQKLLNFCGYEFIRLYDNYISKKSTEKKQVVSFPTPATFASAPNKRLWQMEDKKVFLGNSFEAPSEANSVVMRYATMYSNDWMLFPLETEIGKYITIDNIKVIDTFGDAHYIESKHRAGKNDKNKDLEGPWQMFTNSNKGDRNHCEMDGLYYAPQLAATIEGKPIESVKVLRDEMANMVWGVEDLVTDGCGGTIDANLYATQLKQIVDDINDAGKPKHDPKTIAFGNNETAATPSAKFNYQLQSTVPFNWIPFIPQRLSSKDAKNSTFFLGGREIVLRRGKMPCYLYNEQTADFELNAVRPQGSIMRPKVKYSADGKVKSETPMVIHEEAVQSTGIRLIKNYQRARWIDGSVYQWLGVYKRLAKTEVSSGLTFDELTEK